MLAWRNWQTRTAQDRMGKPVEVRVLSRAMALASSTPTSPRAKQPECPPYRLGSKDYFAPPFLLAAQRAFISWESRFRPAGVSPPFFGAGAVFVPPAFLRAAQRALISSESLLRPAGVSAPFFLAGAGFAVVFCFAQRALAASESLARVVGEK